MRSPRREAGCHGAELGEGKMAETPSSDEVSTKLQQFQRVTLVTPVSGLLQHGVLHPGRDQAVDGSPRGVRGPGEQSGGGSRKPPPGAGLGVAGLMTLEAARTPEDRSERRSTSKFPGAVPSKVTSFHRLLRFAASNSKLFPRKLHRSIICYANFYRNASKPGRVSFIRDRVLSSNSVLYVKITARGSSTAG
jgi:hypothetical protein